MLLVYLLLLASVLAIFVLILAWRRPSWFPWFLLPLAFLPSLLVMVRLSFPAMIAMYITFPAVMGPFALSVGCFFAYNCGVAMDSLALIGLAASLLWLALLRWLWVRQRWAGYLAWLLGLLASGLLMYIWVLPPD